MSCPKLVLWQLLPSVGSIQSMVSRLNLSQEILMVSFWGWVQAEYDIFRRIEENVYQPIYTKPFSSCQELIEFANTILN